MWTAEKASKNLTTGILVLLALLLTIFGGYLVSSGVIGVQSVVILGAGLVTIALLVGKEHSNWILFCLGVASIFFGHRGVYVGYWTFFLPLQVIIWSLFGILLLQAVIKPKRLTWRVPLSLSFIVLWSMIRAIFGVHAGDDWDATLAWTSPFVLGFPVFFVVSQLVKTKDRLILVLRILMVVSGLMSVAALLEYFFPSFTQIFPWFFANSERIVTQQGFVAAPFSFWAYPAAATVIVWGLLVAYDEILQGKSGWRWLALPLITVCAAAVYVSGQRSSWLGFGLALVVLNLPLGIRGWSNTGALLGISSFLPTVFWARFSTITGYLRFGLVADTSMASRLERWTWAWQTILRHPFEGIGYGYWLTHNVLLEIGSKIGVIPAIAFAGFMVRLIGRISRVGLAGVTSEERRYGWLFMALAVTWIVQLSVEVGIFMPPLAGPHWVLIALGWYLPGLFNTERIEA